VPILGHSTWHLYRKVVTAPDDAEHIRDEQDTERPPARLAGLAVGWVARRRRQVV
jgi:hypothetical protein